MAVIKERHDRVLVLRLANPPANVLTVGLLEALRGELAAAAGDSSVRAVVLASAYPRYFSVGVDLDEVLSRPLERRTEPFEALISVHRALTGHPKPTVAAVGGSALLGGWILAMACDVRVASSDAKIALSEVRLGMSPTAALVERMRRICASPGFVRDLVLRGKTARAEEALAAGALDEVVEPGQLFEAALKEARALAKLPATAAASIKRALAGPRTEDESETLWRSSLRELESLLASADAAEGLAAFKEKRRPRWES